MVSRDTALLCHSLARAGARTQRLAIAAAIVFAVPLTASVPVAGAHRTLQRRNHRRCRHAHTPIAAASRHELQLVVVCLINQQRTERHLPRLRINQRLNRSAQGWTTTMVSHATFSHGADFAARISAVGFNWSMVGENIATGFRTPAAAVRAWMASSGHCQNILSPAFADVGTGVSKRSIPGFSSRPGTWTQDFGLWRGAHAPSANWGPANGCPY